MQSRIFWISVFLFINTYLFSQRENPVEWTFSIAKEENSDEIGLVFSANIKEGWVIYGMDEVEDGPIPTSINFDENEHIEFVDELVAASKLIKMQDELFGLELTKYKGTANFIQTVKAKKKGAELTGYVTFMTCDGERCLPPTDIDFSFVID